MTPGEARRASMSQLEEAVRRVRSGPRGPRIGAFFDFDGTLVHGFTGVHFFRKVHRRSLSTRELAATLLEGIRGEKTDADIERFNHLALRAWRGHSESELDQIGANLFAHKIAGHLYPEAWPLIYAHQEAGHTVVIASSASRFQVEPAAKELGIEHILCTQMQVENGVLTGKVAGRMLWRDGKADAVARFALGNDIDLTASYGYANGSEDQPFLELCGHPTAVNPARRLQTVAAEKGWPVLKFRPRPGPRAVRIARTLGGFAGMIGGATAGAIAAQRNDAIHRADRLMAWGTAGALRGAGVKVNVSGAENAVAPRPVVFIFNHQSQFDVIVMAHVLRGGVTGVGKKEIAHNPVFGPMFRFVGATFIDRENPQNAIAALKPVVDTLRGGMSVAVAPEGHRSQTQRLLPFKKGAFHLAMQAGVPIVPVVIRNAGDIMWRNALTLRPGTVDVAFLDPIDVTDWDPANLDDHIHQVRQRFIETINNWPGESG